MKDQKTFKMSKGYFVYYLIGSLFLWIIIIGIPFTISLIIRYLTTQVTVTPDGLKYKTGWLNVSEKQIPYSKINTVDLKRSVLGRMLNYGDIKVFTGNDVEGIVFQGIDSPESLKQAIQSRIP